LSAVKIRDAPPEMPEPGTRCAEI